MLVGGMVACIFSAGPEPLLLRELWDAQASAATSLPNQHLPGLLFDIWTESFQAHTNQSISISYSQGLQDPCHNATHWPALNDTGQDARAC